VIIPIKRFSEAKRRLAYVTSAAERHDLAQRMAERVLEASAPLPVFVVCDNDDVAAWASARGAEILHEEGVGLNPAVASAFVELRNRKFDRVIVAHSDLPLAHDLAWIANYEGITIVPDRNAQGTNVLSLPTDVTFAFSYGPGSFHRHFVSAVSIGKGVRVIPDHALGADIDMPTDLATAHNALQRTINRTINRTM
jgi:2-phospho-L-lactate/phosphoenolpyruvate guanylyltransferase